MQGFQGYSSSKQEASVSQLASSLLTYGSTLISKMLIEKHVRSWQAHLEQISDFLLSGQDGWWCEQEDGDVEFLDGEGASTTHPQGPLLHHFCSSNFLLRKNTLENAGKNAWKKVLFCHSRLFELKIRMAK